MEHEKAFEAVQENLGDCADQFWEILIDLRRQRDEARGVARRAVDLVDRRHLQEEFYSGYPWLMVVDGPRD